MTYIKNGIKNIHYGDILTKFDYLLSSNDDSLPSICDEVEFSYQDRLLKLGDIVVADTAEDYSTGKAVEIVEDSNKIVAGLHTIAFRPNEKFASGYLGYYFNSKPYRNQLMKYIQGIKVLSISKTNINKTNVIFTTNYEEQFLISALLSKIDKLITLHQRKPLAITGGINMVSKNTQETLFSDYYLQWIFVYKEGAIRKVTLDKYYMTQHWIEKLAPDLRLCDLDRINYQKLLNDYALVHERQTTMDFHHQLKGAILDAVDEGLVERDPTRKAIIKGRTPREKKVKYLNQFELHSLLSSLKLGNKINWDWFILLVAKTGMRFSEALAITPKDFDFAHQKLSITKTWNYKEGGGFSPTKNKSSVRKIQIDWQTVIQFSELVKGLDEDKPIFVHSDKIYNSTINSVLSTRCKKVGIPEISIHGLRHTHASLLLFAGVSIASVARRLGHASMTTTQKTYLHIIQELENQDVDLVMRSLSALS